MGYATAGYAGLSPDERRSIEASWLKNASMIVCTSAFGMGINKPDVRWVFTSMPRCYCLSMSKRLDGRTGWQTEYRLTLISEPTGWLDAEDKQRQRFFENKLRSQHQSAQQLAKKLPVRRVSAVARQFPIANALSLLHSAGCLEWHSPFDYIIHPGTPLQFPLNCTQADDSISHHRQCRWQFCWCLWL